MDADLRHQIRSLVSARDKISDTLKRIKLQSKGIYITKGFRRSTHDGIVTGKGHYNNRDYGRRVSSHFNNQSSDYNSIHTDKKGETGLNPTSQVDDGDSMDTVEARPKLDNSLSQGQKRMLSVNILGYLRKAKNQLDFEGTTEKSKKQKEVENSVEDKIRIEKERIETEVAKELEEKKTQALTKLEEIQKQLDEKEDQLLKMKLIEHHKELSAYIQTRCNPPILWLPSKMNEVTSALLENSKQLQQAKIDQIEIRFSKPEDVEMEI